MPPQPADRTQTDRPAGSIPVLMVLVLLVAAGLVVVQRYEPPAVVAADAPSDIFSAARAYQRLEDLLPDNQPHPIGSPANERFRLRLRRQLKELGLDPEENDHWVSAGRGSTTSLVLARNLVAELPSSNPDLPAILLSCHYDSVPAGPGASDDGAAVAALLEVARILLEERPLPRPVILLFTDGEELGLDGARGFSRFNEMADRVGLVVNFEARGSTGGSLMFETSEGNLWIVDQVARALPRPMSSSAYVSVYRKMPNSSDLTVFMQRGLDGINFAYIGRPKHYHTPLDNLANLDQRSLQHHGDNALAIVRQLLNSDWEEASSDEDAVYTDLAASFILSWPASWSTWFSCAILLAMALPFLRICSERRWRVLELSQGLSCWILCLMVGTVSGWLSAVALQALDGTSTPWPAAMHWDLLVPSLASAMGVFLTVHFIRPRPVLLFFQHGLALAAGALALSLVSTGFSYLLLIPAFAATFASLFLLTGRRRDSRILPAACLLVGLITVILSTPYFRQLPDALGLSIASPLLAALVAILLLPVVPLLAPLPRATLRRVALLLFLGTLAAGGLALKSPPFTEFCPQQISLTYLEEIDQESGRLAISPWEGSLPAELTDGFIEAPDSGSLFYDLPGPVYESPRANLPVPEFELLDWNNEGESQSAKIRLIPTLPSQEIVIGMGKGQGLHNISALGRDLPVPKVDRSNRQWLRFRGIPQDGLELILTWKGNPTLLFTLIGITPGLPPHLSDLHRARDGLPGCTAHFGDRSIVLQGVVLDSPVF